MPRVLYGFDDVVADWVGEKNGKAFKPPYSALGIINNEGTLTAGFVFTGFNVDGVELSCAGRGVASRGAWTAVVDYVFEQLGCVRLQAHTRRSNPARKQLTRMGFKFEGVNRCFYGDEDGICFSLIKNDLAAFRARLKLG